MLSRFCSLAKWCRDEEKGAGDQVENKEIFGRFFWNVEITCCSEKQLGKHRI